MISLLQFIYFGITKLIIDNNDLETFKWELEIFSTSFFSDPVDAYRRLIGKIFPDDNDGSVANKLRDQNDFIKLQHKLHYLLEEMIYFDFETVKVLISEIERYENKIRSQDLFQNLDEVIRFLDSIKEDASRLHITCQIYGTFFNIGAYLIYKGIDFTFYLVELLYGMKFDNTYVNNLNHPPISENLIWSLTYSMYGGNGISVEVNDTLQFDTFRYGGRELTKFLILLMLKQEKELSYPFPHEFHFIFSKPHGNERLLFWRKVLNDFPFDTILEDLAEITRITKYKKIIRTNIGIYEKIDTLQNSLSNLQKQIERNKNKLELLIIDDNTVNTFKELLIKDFEMESKAGDFGIIKLDHSKTNSSEFYEYLKEISISSDFFIDNLPMLNTEGGFYT